MKLLNFFLRPACIAIALGLLIQPSAWSDVVAYYNFEGNSLDSSSMGNHGTLMGNATFIGSAPPAIGPGQSLLLDGNDDYMFVNADASLDSNTFSLAFWINQNGVIQNGPFERIVSRTNDTFDVAASSGGLLSYHTSVNGWNSTGHLLPSLGWSHITYTYDGTTLLGYADGTQVYSGNATINPSGDLFVGARWFGPGTEGFQGMIDDFALFDEVLTAAQVANLADGSSTPLTVSIPGTSQHVGNVGGWIVHCSPS